MAGAGDDDREAVDRAFADLVAGYHLTADRPDPLPVTDVDLDEPGRGPTAAPSGPPVAADWADEHPLFRLPEAPAPVPEPEERFVPEPPMPLPRPAWPALLAWLAMGYAVLAVLATAMGLRLPAWAGYLALFGFVGGFAVLVARLPRSRPPDAGNGAVL